MKIIITERQLGTLLNIDKKKFINEQWWFEILNNTWGFDSGPVGQMDYSTTTPKSPMEKTSILLRIKGGEYKLKKLLETKKNITNFCLTNSSVKKPSSNTGEIQDFLISVGLLKTKDWDFKNLSATAAGKFLYGSESKINTVALLHSKLKSDGYEVGSKPFFTNQMAVGLSKKISDVIDSVKKGCEQQKKDINSKIEELKSNIEYWKTEISKDNVTYHGPSYDRTY